MTAQIDTGIIVRPEDRSTWREALARAEDERITLIRTSGATDTDYSTRDTYRVTSGTDAKMRYISSVRQFASPVDGLTTTVSCDCRAGINDRICKHAALALKASGKAPFPLHNDPDEEMARAVAVGRDMLLKGSRWK